MTTRILILLSILVSGFAAHAAEPDFAFPKQVSKTAEKSLSAALKTDNGPAAIRALIDLTLAEGQMEPDSIAMIERRVGDVTARLKNPAAKAMALLVRAEITSDVKWADSALTFTETLRTSPVAPWNKVIEVNSQFAPTLYDFAVAKRMNFGWSDSLLSCIREFHANDPAPLCYWTLAYGADESTGWNLYNRFRQLWISYYPLVWLNRFSGDLASKQRLHTAATEWIAGHPDAPSKAVKEVKTLIELLTKPSMNISCREVNCLGSPLPVKVSGQNLNKATLCVYESEPMKRLVKKYPVEFSGTGVFEVDSVVMVELPSFGKYEIVPVFPGDAVTGRSNRSRVAVTNFVIELETFGNKANRLAVNPESGAEVTGVTYSYDAKDKFRLHAEMGDDKYTPAVSDRTSRAYAGRKTFSRANLWIDRPIYHPGDTVKFALTAMTFNGSRCGVLSGREVTVGFSNVNGREVGSLKGVTDDFGRFSGEFAIPSDGLTGRFSLAVTSEASQIGYLSVLVSDYKAPEFETTLSATRIDSVSVRLDGSATNYSGFPVQNAEVKISVNKLLPWVWFRNYLSGIGESVADTVATTDNAGKFSIVVGIPADGNFTASASVTSALGETHDSHCFIPGKRYFISADIPENLLAPTSPDWQPAVRVVNAEGNTEKVPFICTLISGTDTITDVADWSRVKSGRYDLNIYLTQPDLADTLKISGLTIYRRSDKKPPVESQLWIPESSVASGSELLIGSSFANTHIRYVLCTADSILEQKWLEPLSGNRLQKVTLPEGVNDATLTLWCLRDYNYVTRSVAVSRKGVARNLNLEISSLRDRVNAGDRELWTIAVKDNLGNPADAAVLIDVYSKALEALAPFSFSFNPITAPATRLYLANGGIGSDYSYISKSARWPEIPSAAFSFNTYGRHWPARRIFEYSMTSGRADYAVNARMHKQVLYAAAPMADAETIEVEEAVAEDSCEADAGFGGASEEASEQENYRPSEVPQALWAPVITTGPSGETQIQFVAPDATTTWSIKALTYDRNLLHGAFGADIVASKPVMVQTSLPRFLRQGDKVELRASAINNTDSAATISAYIEIYDPMSGKTIARHDFSAETQKPMSERVLLADYRAEGNLNLIGVRVRATGGNFTDGEQTVIPILPAQVTVTESRPILMDADSASLHLEVKPGSVVELTANAAWECVTALPGLVDRNGSSVFGATSSLFSAAVADGLMRTYPELGKAIRAWENSDSVLVSRLSKNEDLKIALLENTPWVANAESDTERMARLSLLLNKKQIDSQISKSIGNLAKLVRKGGLAWVEGNDEASVWATAMVLSTLGDLNHMGWLPKDKRLTQIVSEAMKYLDAEEAKRFAKSPDSGFIFYLDIRSKFPEIARTSVVRKITASALQHIVADWRKFSYTDMARAALILNSNGYHTTATRLIESLRQNKAWRQTGVSAPVLRAFAAVEPKSAEVDDIRMWLLSRKQTTDWGTGLGASDVIAAIISTGTDWFVPSENSISVRVNGEPYAINASDAYTGSFRINLPEGGTVDFDKGRYPAWGGVWSRFDAGIDSIEATGSKELKITRTVEGEMNVGSRVTVTLTVDADRTMDYVVIESPHAASLQPVNQIPFRQYFAYVEPTATKTMIFINRLPKGRSVFTQEFFVTATGSFQMAPAQIQSQYAPEFTATSSGCELEN